MDAAVLVFADLSSGELDDAGKGILAEGRRLAAMLDKSWGAVCFGGVGEEVLAVLQAFGVPGVLVLGSDKSDLSDQSDSSDRSEVLADLPLAQASALAQAARHTGARVVLLAHDDLSSCLAPALAAQLGAALFTEAVSCGRTEEGLLLRRSLVGPQVAEERVWAQTSPLVLTFATKVLSPVVLPSFEKGDAVRSSLAVSIADEDKGVRITQRVPPDPQTVDVAEAEVIFCAGKGVSREAFDALCELARRVGGSVGVTRPVFDQGFAGFERMIGQTGKTVVPRFYFGLGISGSMHHVGGIKDSKRIVTLNVDPKAPLFANSDEGFVADAGQVLPLLLKSVKSAGAGAR